MTSCKQCGDHCTTNGRVRAALEFLRKDTARFNHKTPVPLSAALVEQHRRQAVNKRYKACLLAKRKEEREKEMKSTGNSSAKVKAIIHDMKQVHLRHRLGSVNRGSKSISSTSLQPWPGFRYHNNGDIRRLSQVEKNRRLLSSMKVGLGNTQSSPEITWFSPVDSRNGSRDDTTKSSRITKTGGSLDTFKGGKTNTSLPRQTSLQDLDNVRTLALPTTSDSRNSFGTPRASNIRLNTNPFRPVVKPLTTSSLWCHGGEDLEKRAALIPKDSFNIKFGVSSKMLKLRKADLDEYRDDEQLRNEEASQAIQRYVANIKTQLQKGPAATPKSPQIKFRS